MSEDRYIRQSGIFSQELLNKHPVIIIGVGAIGRNLAIQLTAMGVKDIKIYDFDTVEEHNVASQGFRGFDVGSKKIAATANACIDINPECGIQTFDRRFPVTTDVTDNVVFMCVDSIRTRKFIFEGIKDKTSLIVDTRMAAESFRILTVSNFTSQTKYKETLFSQDEAFPQSCTSKSTIYCASIAAGFAISSFTKWIRNLPVDGDIFLNLFANEMTYGD